MSVPHEAERPDKRVVVARIKRPWGRRGEVLVDLHTDWPQERFRDGAELELAWDDGRTMAVVAAGFGLRAGKAALALRGVESIGDAEDLRNAWVLADRGAVVVDSDEWHQADLVGLRVVLASGAAVGVVLGIMEGAAGDLIEVRLDDGREALVPLAPPITLEIREDAIVIDPPAGLLDPSDAVEARESNP